MTATDIEPGNTPLESNARSERKGKMVDRLVYTVDEAAGLLGVSRGVAYEQVRSGIIPARRLGKRWVVPKRQFHEWLEGGDA
jgi:excisionase family DNA binding protein